MIQNKKAQKLGQAFVLATGFTGAMVMPSVADCFNGVISWYGPGFHGNPTASGAPFNQNAMTAAHKTLPFGTKVQVKVGDEVAVVTINDRGPYHGNRVLDVSKAAATDLGFRNQGVTRAEICVL